MQEGNEKNVGVLSVRLQMTYNHRNASARAVLSRMMQESGHGAEYNQDSERILSID